MKRFILFVSIAYIVTSVLYAQKVTGKLVDNDNNPLAGANVFLLSKVDSAYIAGTITDNDGTFVLESAKDGDILMCSLKGYHTFDENTKQVAKELNGKLYQKKLQSS